MSELDSYQLTPQLKQEIKAWIAKFPKGKQASAVIMALRLVQQSCGYLQEPHLNAVADFLKMPTIQVYDVFKFYSMFYQKPVGQQVFKVCNSISCYLNGSGDILASLKHQLGIDVGETTRDGAFSLRETECLGSCCQAPCMLVNDHDYHYSMDEKKIATLIDELKEAK